MIFRIPYPNDRTDFQFFFHTKNTLHTVEKEEMEKCFNKILNLVDIHDIGYHENGKGNIVSITKKDDCL